MHRAGERSAARVGERVRLLVDAGLDANSPPDTPIAAGAIAVGRTTGEALDIDGCAYLEPDPDPTAVAPGDFMDAVVIASDVYDLRVRRIPPG